MADRSERWDKLRLLLWKNWTIQKRHKVQTIFEIVIPALCCSMLIMVRGLIEPIKIKRPILYQPIPANYYGTFNWMIPPVLPVVVYSPKNRILDEIVSNAIHKYLDTSTTFTHEAFADSEQLHQAQVKKNYFVGIEFDDLMANITKPPGEIHFALRFPSESRSSTWKFPDWQTNLLVDPFSLGARDRERDDGGDPFYFLDGFSPIQAALSMAIISAHDPDRGDPGQILLNRIPYPPFTEDNLLPAMQQLLPLIILISFFYTCINTVKYITIEKERQLKEAMKIMGLPNWLHWTAWFLRCMGSLLVTITLVTLLMTVNLSFRSDLSVLRNCNWTVLWVFLLAFSVATVSFCCMMSVFFNRANTAAGIAGLMWFFTMMPYNITVSNYDDMGLASRLTLSLLSNTAMSYGVLNIVRLEANEIGLQWFNLFSPATMNDRLNVGLVIIMLLVDAMLYMGIALYIEQIMPGEFGVAKPWNFLFTKEFWNRDKIEDSSYQNVYPFNIFDSKYIEPDPPNLYAGIQIRKLRKAYTKKVAVHGLTLNMYENQITVLLGHNGAGKTTTMSMLTGIFSPTSGTALINGHDIRTDLDGARRSLGLCPQHNVLFDELTVSEHIRFFAKLKGLSEEDIQQEVDKYVQLLELSDKANAQSHTLSGGMKRKLAVGVALCGGSRVVLLDEPTSGMDPSARRALWELVQKEKIGRTILLTTHFMDEADVLGDRITIMAEGSLKAAGSPFFLKKTFGTGYRLICVKRENCNRELLLDILRRHIPDVRLDTDIGTELSIILQEEYVKQFQPMLEDLEQQIEACGISSYGISLTTMEDVFLRSACSTDCNLSNISIMSINQSIDLNAFENIHLLTGRELLINQIQAQFFKNYLSTLRRPISLSMQVLIPIMFVIMTYFIILNAIKELPPLDINLESYSESVTVLEDHQATVAAAYRSQFTNLSQVYELVVIHEPMNDFILRKSKESIAIVNTRYWVGATVTSSFGGTAWFNNKGYHTIPLALNLLMNAFWKVSCSECEILVTNKPLPFRLGTRFEQLEVGANVGFQFAFNTGFAMAFVGALYIMFYIRERTSRSKLLQMVSGVNVTLFWACSFLWDYTVFIIVSLLYLAAVAAIQHESWSEFSHLSKLFLVLLLFGFSIIPTTYMLSFLFDVPATGFVKMMLLNTLSGTVAFTAVTLLKFEGIELKRVAEVLECIFTFFPNYVFNHALNTLNAVSSIEALCDRQCKHMPICSQELLCELVPKCCDLDVFTFGETGINKDLIFLVFVGVTACAVVLMIDYRTYQEVFAKILNNSKNGEPEINGTVSPSMDDDVLAEKQKIGAMSPEDIKNYNLVLRDVSKYYGKFRAVNNISVAIPNSECFGLLGINGAGKTSTFKMMTGDVNITSGEAWVTGISLLTDMIEVHKHIGYCPQFNALLDDLTGRETLKLYGLLRGIPPDDIGSVSAMLADDLNFTRHLDKKTKDFSEGNRRKLSTALALIGNPVVVYLDEPTTGMDPGSKRHFWNVMCKVREAGKSVVLTSHSMEECEALCTRLAIMVNGEFKCLGSTQHLKNKFSEGFTLLLKTKPEPPEELEPRVEAVKQFVQEKFEGAVLKEQYQDSLSFQIPRSEMRWSTMFGLMEAARESLAIEDYALGQASLEQVFLHFTKYQREEVSD
ncbi:phospholipid-transporting ATPase ABCA1-like [Uranotaenia lowii]|uniref:phospholipid-transporting ATPase ABCA1-like n=1 Tax=Uranotaenia lowii TaxID=190385 RepID=UPI0024789C90|nr:phospholipid-transporting ATPase ABCA1-like [Uranotaenia lowii]